MIKENYFIVVDEPWNFESADGKNIVRGSIIDIKTNHCIVFRSNYCLEFEERKGYILILSPRQKGVDFTDLTTSLISINGGLLLRKYDIKLSEKELKENSNFVIIGSLMKQKDTF